MMAWLLGFGIPIGYITMGFTTSIYMYRKSIHNEVDAGWDPKGARRRAEGDPTHILAGMFWPVMPFIAAVCLLWGALVEPLYNRPTKAEIAYDEKKAIESAKEVVYGKTPAQDYIRDYIRSMDY